MLKLIDAIKKLMVANKLSLNLSKSNIILVNPTCYSKENISSDLATADDVKYLGVTFDKNLTFDSHIRKLEKIYLEQ